MIFANFNFSGYSPARMDLLKIHFYSFILKYLSNQEKKQKIEL